MPEIPEKFYKVHNRQIINAMNDYIQTQTFGVRSYAILAIEPFGPPIALEDTQAAMDKTVEVVYIEVCNERGTLKVWVSSQGLAAIERWLEEYKDREIEDFTWPKDIFRSSPD